MSFMSLSAKDRLRRTQSARSMRRPRQTSFPSEPFDPVLARKQATAAASRAMLRSSDRSSIESKHSYDRLGGLESMAVPSRRPPPPPSRSQAPSDAPSTANASPSRQSVASYIESQDDELLFSAALPPINEFRGLDGRDSSLPSSYRRLRKARSMFSTRQRSSHVSHDIQNMYSRNINDRDSFESPRSYRTLRRSISFLRSGQSWRTVHRAQNQDAAIQLARSQFQEDMANNTNQPRRSSLTMLKPRREYKPFRKTFRTPSGAGIESDASPSNNESRQLRSREKARSISSSIKRGIKRVLGLSKPPSDQKQMEESVLPLQQHDDLPLPAPMDSSNYPEDINYPDAAIDRDRPHTVHSVRSNESLATSRSRVTSWADSTVANTIATRKAPERNNLSIIEEQAALYNRSSSPDPSARLSPVRPDGSIDSKRLYSALLRRIGRDNIPSPESEVTLGQVKEHRLIPAQMSSLRPRRSRQTVRSVPSDESIATFKTFATANAGSLTPQKQTYRYSQSPIFLNKLSTIHDPAGRAPNNSPVGTTAGYAPTMVTDADEDSKSVIFTQHPDPEPLSNSPSIYSRTTSGNSPDKKDQAVDLYTSETEDEPGTVTIYESQRTIYSSPKRISRYVSTGHRVRPSAEWKQWMSSQMAGLETSVSTRDHYREHAQIHSEEGDFVSSPPSQGFQGDGLSCSAGTMHTPHLERDAGVEAKVAPSSNFSRPFSCSSSIPTIAPSRKEAVRDHANNTTVWPSSGSVFTSPSANNHPHEYVLSPIQTRSSNRLPVPESPTPKRGAFLSQERKLASERYRRYSTRRLTASSDARSPQVGLINRPTNENSRTGDLLNKAGTYGQSQGINLPMSSQRMVEVFLNSRRHQPGAEKSDDGTPEGAFI
ncbi:uncharacterized protein ACLA_012840 [Aspergillus clavatus NRRL 1]|uniref:Uncharacterized protein n=1 Tax=Aspergillus clavatus (strain ATCC 1007 / CBS 513.65 / DSM 816 / NCTC 3887 / NRRL 1 / QM 1276 / 107) TaxID=344612 RepID=A1CAT8_ASPCL|nr:uncharacterized protein ACLA_012840 [Aspergillus clavatus NRRL 1]EAW12856.1 conserved hypothetical protein [Aspergillus clavatus NRRL 1]